MITNKKFSYVLKGPHTDNLPRGVPNGTKYKCTDDDEYFMYDEANDIWYGPYSSFEIGILSGTPPFILRFAIKHGLIKLKQYGKMEQTPATYLDTITQEGKCVQNGADIMCNNGALKYGATGKNLFDIPASVTKGGITFTKDSDGYVTASPSNADSRSWGKNSAQFLVNLAPGKYKFVIKLKTPSASQYSGWEIYSPAGVKIAGSSGGKFRADEVAAFTASESGNYYIMAKMHTSASRLMVVKDGADTSNYEPYTEGIYTDGTPEVLTILGEESETLSGDVVTFEANKAMTVTEGKIGIEAEQDLNGYDSPWPAGGGKNLFNGTFLQGYWAYADGGWVNSNAWIATEKIPCKPSTYYTASADNRQTRWQGFVYYDNNGDFISTQNLNSKLPIGYTAETPANAAYLIFDIAGESETTDPISPSGVTHFQIEEGQTATSYAPYSNICPISGYSEAKVYVSPTQDAQDATVYTIDLDGARYGGTLDVTAGTLTVDRAYAVFDGSSDENWRMHGTIASWFYTDNAFTNVFTDASASNFSISNAYEQYPYRTVANIENGKFAIGYSSGSTVLRTVFKDTRYTTVQEWTDAVATNHIQLCYKLATPIEITLTPTQIQTLVGVNNIWSDTGSIESLKYGTVQTASVVNLFSTLDGSARDEVDVVSGVVTRRTEAVYEGGGIVVKALAEPITEQTTAHNIDRNLPKTIGYTANVSNITITTTQSTHTTPSPYCPLNFVCNNGELYVSNGSLVSDGTAEVITLSATGYDDQTASVVDLFAVGNYRDEHELIKGTVTRRIGVAILDGTESIEPVSAGVFSVSVQNALPDSAIASTHFSHSSDVSTDGSACISENGLLLIRMDSIASVSDLRTFFSSQSASGSPVVVFYPLSDAVTEQTAAQALETHLGDNTLTASINVQNVDFYIEYAKNQPEDTNVVGYAIVGKMKLTN